MTVSKSDLDYLRSYPRDNCDLVLALIEEFTDLEKRNVVLEKAYEAYGRDAGYIVRLENRVEKLLVVGNELAGQIVSHGMSGCCDLIANGLHDWRVAAAPEKPKPTSFCPACDCPNGPGDICDCSAGR